jgi:hypothetical protein
MIKQRLLSLMGWASLAAERKRSQPCVRIAGEWHSAENTTNRSIFFTSRYSPMSQPIIPAANDYRGSVRLRTALRPKTCDTVLVELPGDLAAQFEILRYGSSMNGFSGGKMNSCGTPMISTATPSTVTN